MAKKQPIRQAGSNSESHRSAKVNETSVEPAAKSSRTIAKAPALPKDQGRKPSSGDERVPGRVGRPPRFNYVPDSSERAKTFDTQLLERGGRILNKLRIDGAPSAALARLKEQHKTDRAAIEFALLECDPARKAK